MKAGHLSEYFSGIAAKRLSAVEANFSRSHQHEFNGVKGLKKILGEVSGKKNFSARFVYLNDEDDPAVEDGSLTWYDARERHPARSEYRLYFPSTTVSECAAEGDLLVIGLRPDGSVLVVIAESNSTIANQIQWLFGVTDVGAADFIIREDLETVHDRIEFTSRFILENIGINVVARAEDYLETMIRQFGGGFPSTNEFSAYARSTVGDVDSQNDPDAAIMAWMDREEILFRSLERHLIADRLAEGFQSNTDGFISFSLSVQNRRKSRAGFALENHMEAILLANGIRYKRSAVTENKSKPDFIFPGDKEYHDPNFDPLRLTMLGVKSTCKDRWRQILAEADRIPLKHLLTLETAISTPQTDEMRSKKLQLVLPCSLHATFTVSQQAWIIDISSFLKLLHDRQYIKEGHSA